MHLDSITPDHIDAIWDALGAPENPALLPAYFVKTTFVKMGGRALALRAEDGGLCGVALLFPRGIAAGRRVFTARLHSTAPLPEAAELARLVESGVAPDHAILYRPEWGRGFADEHREVEGFDLGAPGPADLAGIRDLQDAIWQGGPGDRYPDDLHSVEFGLPTSLVARRDGRLVGFLFGFYRFDGLEGLAQSGLGHRTDLSLESQVMGVDPAYRRFGLAALLKREQARRALAAGLDVIHWTADPLQFPNAALNFGRLRAVAGEHYRAYYPFQNALNRVTASRLGLTWLPRSAWGRAGLEARAPHGDRSLGRFPGCAILNDGPSALAGGGDAPQIAVEIPVDWTDLQQRDPALSTAWRDTTDALLSGRLGFAPGRYVIADVAAEGDRRYLIGHRFEALQFQLLAAG